MNEIIKDEWVTSIYENCSIIAYGLQLKEDLTQDELGLQNVCEVVVLLYDELYGDPIYIADTLPERVLH
jgi:hypothetical protein